MKKTIIILLLIFIQQAFSRPVDKAYYNWLFGRDVFLTFNTNDGKPNAVYEPMIVDSIGNSSASISDMDGNLQFYSNTKNIWNYGYNQIKNGILKGHNHASQPVIIRFPENDVKYLFVYPIRTSITPLIFGIRYAIIDMSLDSGRGEVIEKDIPLLDNCYGIQTACKHKNGKDFWIVLLKNSDKTYFYSYLFTENGITGNPIISEVNDLPYDLNVAFNMHLSSDGTKIVIDATANLRLYHFNNETGKVIDYLTFPPIGRATGNEFSPDGSKIYILTATDNELFKTGLYQFDLNAGDSIDIIKSKLRVGGMSDYYKRGHMWNMQLAPDGKIYWSYNHDHYIEVIHNPNAKGLACNYDSMGVKLADGSFDGNVVPFCIPEYIYTDLKIEHNQICEGDTLFLNAVFQDGAVYEWSGPNGFIDSLKNTYIPDFSSKNNGLYRVIARTGYSYRVAEVDITVDTLPRPVISGKFEFCDGEGTRLYAPNNYKTYLWSTGEKTGSIWVRDGGNYSVMFTNNNGCEGSATATVIKHPKPDINIKGSLFLCEGSTSELSSDTINPNFKYKWNTYDTTPKITVKDEGYYRLVVTNEMGCSDTAEVEVKKIKNISAQISGNNKFCKGELTTLKAEPMRQ